MRGAEGVIAQLCSRLGIQPGQTTADGQFTLSTVECLGSCGTAPVLIVNTTYHENIDSARLDGLLRELRRELRGELRDQLAGELKDTRVHDSPAGVPK